MQRPVVIVIESLKKRKAGVHRQVPVPPELLDTMDMVHGIREIQKRGRARLNERLWPWSRMTAWRKMQALIKAAGIPDGPPLRFRWRRALHEVALAEGPERIAMEWWRHQPAMPTRDYFRVEDKSGRRFWLYRAGLYGRETNEPKWFVHGVFA